MSETYSFSDPRLSTLDGFRVEITPEKQRADVESQMVKPKATLSQAIEVVLKSDQAELEAQLLETEAWRVLFKAQQAMKKFATGSAHSPAAREGKGSDRGCRERAAVG